MNNYFFGKKNYEYIGILTGIVYDVLCKCFKYINYSLVSIFFICKGNNRLNLEFKGIEHFQSQSSC